MNTYKLSCSRADAYVMVFSLETVDHIGDMEYNEEAKFKLSFGFKDGHYLMWLSRGWRSEQYDMGDDNRPDYLVCDEMKDAFELLWEDLHRKGLCWSSVLFFDLPTVMGYKHIPWDF